MRFSIYITLISIFYISSVSCVSNVTYENMKIGITQFNEAGNEFFNFIRTRLDPNLIVLNDFKNFTLSFGHIFKMTNYYLSYSILLVIGVSFAMTMPFIGLLLLCCRCFGKCGSKSKLMDPKFSKCKRIMYAFILTVLTTTMLFGVIVTLFNNQIIHETIQNQDETVNVFHQINSNFQQIKAALTGTKEDILRSKFVGMNLDQVKELTNNLNGHIKTFFMELVNVQEVLNVIKQTKSMKSVLDRENVPESKLSVQNVNINLTKLNDSIQLLKTSIKVRLNGCSDEKCVSVIKRTNRLRLVPVPQPVIEKLTKALDFLETLNIQDELTKIINMKENSDVSVKLFLDNQLKYINDKISEPTFLEAVKSVLLTVIDNLLLAEQVTEVSCPYPNANSTIARDIYKKISTMETYRFYGYLAVCSAVLLIVSCYYLGILFGTCGARPIEDVSCCNRAVGCRFMIGAVTLTFLFSSMLMVVVLVNMMSVGVVQTDVCRYTELKNDNDTDVLDAYINQLSQLANVDNVPKGVMGALFDKCSSQNLYSSFGPLYQPVIKKNIEAQFKNSEDQITGLFLSQVNITRFLNMNPIVTVSSIDINMVHSIALLKNDQEMTEYLKDLSSVLQNFPHDISTMTSVNNQVIQLRNGLGKVVNYLNDIDTELKTWKQVGRVFDDNKMVIIKSKLSQLIASLQANIFIVVNDVFNNTFANVSCKQLRLGVIKLFKTVCHEFVDPWNGAWYGIGVFLVLAIPAVVCACALTNLYRRVNRYKKDKPADYTNYTDFYTRTINDDLNNNRFGKKPAHRGYNPISLQLLS